MIDSIIQETNNILKLKTGITLDCEPYIIADDRLDSVGLEGAFHYRTNTILVNSTLDYEDFRRALIHEYGHYIHFNYLGNRRIRLPREGKSKYADIDHRENFAVAFENLIVDRYDDYKARNDALIRLLKKHIVV